MKVSVIGIHEETFSEIKTSVRKSSDITSK
jgi:hypothetical protein